MTFKGSPTFPGSETCLDPDENPPILKMAERHGLGLFRTVEGLQQKAGVAATRLLRLVLKEIADNALDTGSEVQGGEIDDGDGYFVEDDGPGIDGTPEEIAELFSIRRPMLSTKLLRLPKRGALGNGLRVVAGAVLASEGSLVVITRNRRIVLRPEATARPRSSGDAGRASRSAPASRSDSARRCRRDDRTRSHGSRAALPRWRRRQDLRRQVFAVLVRRAAIPRTAARARRAAGAQLIAQLDGCTGGKAGRDRRGGRARPHGLRRASAAAKPPTLLRPRASTPARSSRSGSDAVGRDAYAGALLRHARAAMCSSAARAAGRDPVRGRGVGQQDRARRATSMLACCVNRTPVTGEIDAYRDSDKDI